ncbi:MAG: helix-turn-helix domain-containing protein [Microbacterium arborescens]
MSEAAVIRIEFPPALMTRELAAYYLSCSVREIDQLKAQGQLIAVGNGKRIRFRKAELDRWVDALPERT